MNARQRRKAWRKRDREAQRAIDALLADPAVQEGLRRATEQLLVLGCISEPEFAPSVETGVVE
jgi:hypothetical protein